LTKPRAHPSPAIIKCSGTIAPVTAANVQNVGLNQGAGGFAGGPDAFMAAAGPAISVVFPEVAPFIAAYNSASAANKGQYGLALVNALGAAGIYAAQNPDSQIGQMVNGVIDSVKSSLPQSVQDALNTSTTPSTPVNPSTGTSLGNLTNAQQLPESVLNPNFVNTPQPGDLTNLSQLGTGTASLPTTNTPVPFTNMTGVSPTSSSVSSTAPATTNSTSPIVNNTGLTPSTPSTPSAAAPAAAAAGGAAANTAGGAAAGGAAAGAAAGLTTAQIAALAAAGVSLVNNSTLTNANNSAAATQAAAGQNAQNLIQALYTQQGQLQSPYQQAGVNALNTLGSLGSGTYNIMNPTGGTTGTGTGSGYLTNQFNNTDLNAQLAPNYAFQLQQGQGQAQNAANVGGGLLSGNTLQGLNTYTQNYAQGAYQNAFTNYQTQRNNIYNTLAGQAGLGANANQQLSNLGGGLAQTYGNVTTGLAASAAGQQVANAQNNTNLLSNLTNAAVTAFAPTPATTTLKLSLP